MNAPAQHSLTETLRSSLQARIERLLQRPLVAELVVTRRAPPEPVGETMSEGGLLAAFDALFADAPLRRASRVEGWTTHADDSATVRIRIDYADVWRGKERDVLEEVEGTREREVVLLTEHQATLLRSSPREFIETLQSIEAIELVDYETERIGGAEQVVALHLVCGPDNAHPLTHAAILPNLVPLQRQLAALQELEGAEMDGPLAPLRALVGLPTGPLSSTPRDVPEDAVSLPNRLDPTQRRAIALARQTPHFATIQGPPGSGKTTVISTILQQALSEGQRVLVVSPTNVATDNVVEKLTEDDASGFRALAPSTLPVRYASKKGRILPRALRYWVGPSQEHRAATVSQRLLDTLAASSPEARAWVEALDPEQAGRAPLSKAIAQRSWVLCGTPIGLLSAPELRDAAAASFDLLVVDEVSKLTLPEFLAIAVYAKRWVLVGDPQQLPPYNDACENAATAEAALSSALELVCSVTSVLERLRTHERPHARLVVVAREPAVVFAGVQAQLQTSGLDAPPPVHLGLGGGHAGVVICTPDEHEAAVSKCSSAARLHRGHNPHHQGSVRILVERGLSVPRPEVASGARFVDQGLRVCAAMFEKVFDTFHAQPWTLQAEQKLLPVQFRKGLPRFLPSAQALTAMGEASCIEEAHLQREAHLQALADCFAANAISVYDWVVGAPHRCFDVEPMTRLAAAMDRASPLHAAVAPFRTVLERQYRMHPSLSLVPRQLFYFGAALLDGRRGRDGAPRVRLVPVVDPNQRDRTNRVEAEEIAKHLTALGQQRPAEVLVITPYRDQERLLRDTLDGADLGSLEVEVCTLDRCQGREADFVFISLVRPRSTPFLDAPKRWNVALTRAREALFLYGHIEAYLDEAHQKRSAARRYGKRPLMSLLARLLSAYERQLAGHTSHL